MAADERTALVTGAASGIGRATAARLVHDGAATKRYPDLPSAIERFVAASAPAE